MDKEKLKTAADISQGNVEYNDKNNHYDGFIMGADWLMEQPLSERLSEAEREKIRDIMKHPQWHTEPIKGTLNFQAIGIQKVLTDIFGADLFNPNQPTAI